MKKIVIASACRTAIGKFGGTLANVPAAELGSIVIKEALNRANVKPEQVDHVYMGCVIQAGLGILLVKQIEHIFYILRLPSPFIHAWLYSQNFLTLLNSMPLQIL